MTLAINKIAFTGNDNDNKVRATEVGVATGATVGGAKYGYSALKRFTNRDVVGFTKTATHTVKEAANATSKVKSLWAKMAVNAGKYKDAILTWAKKTSTGKFAKKVVNSKAFGKFSGLVGGLGAMFVFISGIGEMGNTISKISHNEN